MKERSEFLHQFHFYVICFLRMISEEFTNSKKGYRKLTDLESLKNALSIFIFLVLETECSLCTELQPQHLFIL